MSSEVASRTSLSTASTSCRWPKRSGAFRVSATWTSRLRQRHQARTRALVQGLEQRLHLVLEHAGHQPFAALFADLVEHEQRHGHGQAVARVAGLVQVGGRAVHAAQAMVLGKARW